MLPKEERSMDCEREKPRPTEGEPKLRAGEVAPNMRRAAALGPGDDGSLGHWAPPGVEAPSTEGVEDATAVSTSMFFHIAAEHRV